MTPVIHIFDAPLASHIASHLRDTIGERKRLALLADSNTYSALGRDIHEALLADYDIELRLLPAATKADKAIANVLSAQLEMVEAVLCVGSGSLNDMGKYIAHQLSVPYIICPTAASMNGYNSATSSLYDEGYKVSLSTKAADFILVDSQTIANAPDRFTKAGLGDSLCRSLVQCDAYLSHRLLGTAYNPTWFDTQCEHEDAVLRDIPALLKGERQYTDALFQWLLASGEAMRSAGSSIPASQGEHMIAHVMSMIGAGQSSDYLHGEEIAVTSLTTAKLYDEMLEKEAINLRAITRDKAQAMLSEYFSNEMVESFLHAAEKKGIFSETRVAELNDLLKSHWLAMREQLKQCFIGHEKLHNHLTKAELPTSSEALGWNSETYEKAVRLAPLTRDRFTVLDLTLLSSAA